MSWYVLIRLINWQEMSHSLSERSFSMILHRVTDMIIQAVYLRDLISQAKKRTIKFSRLSRFYIVKRSCISARKGLITIVISFRFTISL